LSHKKIKDKETVKPFRDFRFRLYRV